jgi:hypothetical protein
LKPWTYLRIASILTLLHSVLHTIGAVFGAPPPGPASAAVSAMKSNQFQVIGVTRTYWEFYRGMGLAVTILLTVEAVVFWLLGSLAKRDAARLRPILAVFLLGYLALAVNSLAYIFAPPAVVEGLIALCLVLALISAKSETAAS